MQLGDVLIKRNLVTPEQVEEALRRQRGGGERLGAVLVAMGVLTEDQLNGVLNAPPKAPRSLADTNVSPTDLRNLLLKAMNFVELRMSSQIAQYLKLPAPIVREILEDCVNQKLVESLGSTGDGTMLSELSYALTAAGKDRAAEALELSAYLGPAPVCLQSYRHQIEIQKITNERVSPEDVESAFDGLVISDRFMENIGPAVNSGRCILLYGLPGNGKTSVAERVAQIFRNIVYVPHCVHVDGQIIKVFDPAVHVPVEREEKRDGVSILRDSVDRRWVACKRPVVITGGEFSLEMLDLNYNAQARFYEAPLHVKALGGTFIVDDFGRQRMSPTELLNRWIVPLQSRVDYLKLQTGQSFQIPFDELVIFSTNMEPDDLMDPAFLRRIPYKLETIGPDVDQFRSIFEAVAANEGLRLDDETFRFVVEELTVRNDHGLAGYQPRFIVDQVLSASKYRGAPPELNCDLVARALGNLYAKPTQKAHDRVLPGPPAGAETEGPPAETPVPRHASAAGPAVENGNADSAAPRSSFVNVDASRGVGKTVLVVDDDVMHRKMSREALEKMGFTVEEAADGREGLQAVENSRPDLLLLDIRMPEMDGVNLCSRLRGDPAYADLPILMVTGMEDAESIERAFEVGATNLLTKPVNWPLFTYNVRNMCFDSAVTAGATAG